MRHKFLVLTVKKLLKSVYIYGSYRKIKTGVSLFLDHPVDYEILMSYSHALCACALFWTRQRAGGDQQATVVLWQQDVIIMGSNWQSLMAYRYVRWTTSYTASSIIILCVAVLSIHRFRFYCYLRAK